MTSAVKYLHIEQKPNHMLSVGKLLRKKLRLKDNVIENRALGKR